MSWKGGYELLDSLIEVVEETVDNDDAKAKIYERMIDEFMNCDCNTIFECIGKSKVFDRVYKDFYPQDFEEEQ